MEKTDKEPNVEDSITHRISGEVSHIYKILFLLFFPMICHLGQFSYISVAEP